MLDKISKSGNQGEAANDNSAGLTEAAVNLLNSNRHLYTRYVYPSGFRNEAIT